MLDGIYRDPYDKPGWDPVLFFHSCYIAHLCCFSRDVAMSVGVYSDDGVTGCHDYDTFTRFYLNGYEPRHISEIVYSWRMHELRLLGIYTPKNIFFRRNGIFCKSF